MKSFDFKGLLAPVFTSFNNDETQTPNYDSIEPYAKYLKDKGLKAVLIQGTTGEGTSLSLNERKINIEKWSQAAQRYGLKLMVQIGGTCFHDVVELAKHSEKYGADALLCLPELYFKPRNIAELVQYLKDVAKFVPEMPLLYYHIPMLTDLTFNMPDFMNLAEKEIPNFKGIKYTSDDLDALPIECYTANRSIFIGSDVKMLEALRRGFDSFIMTSLSMKPEFAQFIQKEFKNPTADAQQEKLSAYMRGALAAGGGNWVISMKKEFNLLNPPFPLGAPRKPL